MRPLCAPSEPQQSENRTLKRPHRPIVIAGWVGPDLTKLGRTKKALCLPLQRITMHASLIRPEPKGFLSSPKEVKQTEEKTKMPPFSSTELWRTRGHGTGPKLGDPLK